MHWGNRTPQEEWEDEKPVHTTWVDWFLNIIIAFAVAFVLWIACFVMTANAKGAGGHIAGVNKQLAKTIRVAEKRYERKVKRQRREARLEEKRKQKLEEEQKALEEKYKAIFGYVPSENETQLLLAVTMAECGNTEPDVGIERVIEVIANRCRDGRFPSTITEVCYQRGQFETVSTGAIYRYKVNERVERAYQAVVERGYCSDKQVCFFTAGGYNSYCRPAYVIGNHYFGY